MPNQVKARAAQDPQEERQVSNLAGSHHAPADRKFHAQVVLPGWVVKTQSADEFNNANLSIIFTY